ncbi:MAG: hypothetical protein M1822_007406 [Bathelium mastoideum]|nr:MAG: hypothetical protein M1822_007406 [Bathelium mastoideum]
MVDLYDADPTGLDAVNRYEKTLREAETNGTKIRALILVNPHNPLGRCYTGEALEAYLRLCAKYHVHLISDEIYAMSVFPNDDVPYPKPFISVLGFNLKDYIDPSLVHVLYGMSKDFCSNGLLVGALISQANPRLSELVAFSKLAYASTMAQQAWTVMLQDDEFIAGFFQTYRSRLRYTYERCANYLIESNIPYQPASAGPFIWIDLSKYLLDDTVESEQRLAVKIFHHRLFLATGETYHAEKNGWFRLTFALPDKTIKVALER